MEIKLQTKVTDQNSQDFFKNVYPHLNNSKDQLIQLNDYNVSTFVLVDCCGWHYKSIWQELSIIGLETLSTLKEYKLDRQKFQGIIDNRDHTNIKWPAIDVNNCALIFDRSVLLKYRTVDNIVNVITDAAEKYYPAHIVLNAATLFIDDSRFGDRVTALSKLIIPGYVVTSFVYSITNIKISFKKKLDA